MPAPQGRSSSVRVLIVDDDVSVSDAFSRALRLEGVEVWAALSGAEGLALARKHAPDVVVLDLRMPLSSTLALARSLRGVPGLADAPIGIVTSDYHIGDGQRAEAITIGAELRFKPLWLDELVGLARDLLSVPVGD